MDIIVRADTSGEISQQIGSYTVGAIVVVVVGYFVLRALGVIGKKSDDSESEK